MVPEWKYNSSHAGKIASWIAKGYLGKKGLSERLKISIKNSLILLL